MLKAGSSFSFSAKTPQVLFGSPSAQTDYFERNDAIETLLARPINYPLTATPYFFQQLVVTEFGWNLYGVG
jgi:hypothetical protein